MAQETELKLRIAAQHIDRFKRHPLLHKLASAPPKSRTLFNVYFDTPDLALNRHRVALRIREAQGRYIQTLKTQGQSVGGLHQRGEWEWELPAPELQLDLLPESAWPSALQQDARLTEQLQEVFRTDFLRTTWQLTLPGQGNEEATAIELALDQGTVTAGSRHDSICEVELELQQGNSTRLFQVAHELARDLPLQLSNISKAQRGFRLVAPDRMSLAPSPPRLQREDSVAEVFSTLMEFELACWQQELENFDFSGEWEHLEQLQNAVTGLRANLLLFSRLIPRARTRALRDELTWLSRRLQHVLTAWRTHQALARIQNAQDTSLNQRALALTDYPRLRLLYHQLVDDNRMSLLALDLAARLHRNHWLRLMGDSHTAAAPFNGAGDEILERLWRSIHLPRQPMHKQAWLQQLTRLRRFVHALTDMQELYGRKQTQPLARESNKLLVMVEQLDGLVGAEGCIRVELPTQGEEDPLVQHNLSQQRSLLFELGRQAQVVSAQPLFWR